MSWYLLNRLRPATIGWLLSQPFHSSFSTGLESRIWMLMPSLHDPTEILTNQRKIMILWASLCNILRTPVIRSHLKLLRLFVMSEPKLSLHSLNSSQSLPLPFLYSHWRLTWFAYFSCTVCSWTACKTKGWSKHPRDYPPVGLFFKVLPFPSL